MAELDPIDPAPLSDLPDPAIAEADQAVMDEVTRTDTDLPGWAPPQPCLSSSGSRTATPAHEQSPMWSVMPGKVPGRRA